MKLPEPYSKYFNTNLYKRIEKLSEIYESCSNPDQCRVLIEELSELTQKFLNAVERLER
jgi:hypothetical protein